MAVFRRLRELELTSVRSTYGPNGLLATEVSIPHHVLVRAGVDAEASTWVSVLRAEQLLSRVREHQRITAALGRRAARLPEARHQVRWEDLSHDEKRHLMMTQKEWNSFRAHGHEHGHQAHPPASPPASHQGGPGNHH